MRQDLPPPLSSRSRSDYFRKAYANANAASKDAAPSSSSIFLSSVRSIKKKKKKNRPGFVKTRSGRVERRKQSYRLTRRVLLSIINRASKTGVQVHLHGDVLLLVLGGRGGGGGRAGGGGGGGGAGGRGGVVNLTSTPTEQVTAQHSKALPLPSSSQICMHINYT